MWRGLEARGAAGTEARAQPEDGAELDLVILALALLASVLAVCVSP